MSGHWTDEHSTVCECAYCLQAREIKTLEAKVLELEESQRKLFGIVIRLGGFVVRECCAIDDWDEKASNRLRGAVVQAKKEAEAAKLLEE